MQLGETLEGNKLKLKLLPNRKFRSDNVTYGLMLIRAATQNR